MLRTLKIQRHIVCLLLGAGMLWSCDTEIIFEPKYATPTCSDGIKNKDEQGIDCGSDTCGPCFAIFEPAPCAASVRMDKVMLNQREYLVSNLEVNLYGSAGTVTYYVYLTLNGIDGGSLKISLANYSYLQKSTVYTLDPAEANTNSEPFYNKATLEYFPPSSAYASTSSKGKLYVEKDANGLMLTVCDILLSNSVNFSNTYMITGKIEAETY